MIVTRTPKQQVWIVDDSKVVAVLVDLDCVSTSLFQERVLISSNSGGIVEFLDGEDW